MVTGKCIFLFHGHWSPVSGSGKDFKLSASMLSLAQHFWQKKTLSGIIPGWSSFLFKLQSVRPLLSSWRRLRQSWYNALVRPGPAKRNSKHETMLIITQMKFYYWCMMDAFWRCFKPIVPVSLSCNHALMHAIQVLILHTKFSAIMPSIYSVYFTHCLSR